MSAWSSFAIGLIACVYWAPLVHPQLTRWLPVAFVWYEHRWFFCCAELILPIFGVLLGMDGLSKATGRLRWLARAGILLSLASELTYLSVIVYFVTHAPLLLGG